MSSAGSGRRKWYVAAAALGVVVLLSVIVMSGDGEETVAEAPPPGRPVGAGQAPTSSGPVEAEVEPEVAPEVQPDVEVAPDPEPRVVSLVGLPDGADVTLDGRPIDSTDEIVIPDDGDEHLLEARADGFVPWRTTADSEGPDEIEVEMEREPAPEVAPTMRTAPVRRPTRATMHRRATMRSTTMSGRPRIITNPGF
jgi:hypothetical protein